MNLKTTMGATANDAKTLISNLSLEKYLIELKSMINLSDKYFNELYLKPCLRLIEYSQCLPDSNAACNSYMPAIFYKLNFIIAGMRKSEGVIPKNVKAERLNAVSETWRYQLFFSLMMYGMGPMLMHHLIYVRHRGQYVRWEPLQYPIPLGAEYVISGQNPETSHLATPAFIHHFFDRNLVGWLLSTQIQADIFQSITFPKLDDELGKTVLNVYGDYWNRPSRIQPSDYAASSQLNTAVDYRGKKFLEWLSSSIKNNSIKKDCRGALIYTHDKYYAVATPGIFHHYSQDVEKEWAITQRSFLKLQLHDEDRSNQPHKAYHKIKTTFGNELNCMLIPCSTLEDPKRQKETMPIKTEKKQDSALIPFLKWVIREQNTRKHIKRHGELICFRVKDGLSFVIPDIVDCFSKETKTKVKAQTIVTELKQLDLNKPQDEELISGQSNSEEYIVIDEKKMIQLCSTHG